MSQKYSKPPTNTSKQLSFLKDRGLIIESDEQVENYLLSIGYYRLICGYGSFFKRYDGTENFINGTNFQQIIDLYIFDQKLKILILEALERVEVTIRGLWGYHISLATEDTHPHLNMNNFTKESIWNDSIKKIDERLSKSQNLKHIAHYNRTYNDPSSIHVWGVLELLTFGELSRLVSNTKSKEVKKNISKKLGFGTSFCTMNSIISSLTIFRNHISHHGRLFDYTLINQLPSIEGISLPNLKGNVNNIIELLSFILLRINPKSSWYSRIRNLIDDSEVDIAKKFIY